MSRAHVEMKFLHHCLYTLKQGGPRGNDAHANPDQAARHRADLPAHSRKLLAEHAAVFGGNR